MQTYQDRYRIGTYRIWCIFGNSMVLPWVHPAYRRPCELLSDMYRHKKV